MKVNKELKEYIEKNILPLYESKFTGNDINRIKYVITRAEKLVKDNNLKIDNNILYTAICYHDIGQNTKQDKHEEISAEIMIKDTFLNNFFSKEELTTIKEAIEDHRSNLEYEPRNIYGKLLSSASRNSSVNQTLQRSYTYGKKLDPNATDEELFERAYNVLLKKFGKNGYAKFYFKDEVYDNFLKELQALLEDKEKFINTQREYITKNKIIKELETKDYNQIVESLSIEMTDNMTNQIREYLDSCQNEEIKKIKDFLNEILNTCYNNELFKSKYNYKLPLKDENKIFLLKESVIYFLGRLKVKPDIDILKKVYFLEDNKYIKLNILFTTLITFDEEIENDFTNKIKPGNEYDIMIRSWTMAFFKNVDNPHNYTDKETDDWTIAKTPRIKRLSINEENNPKFIKAMSFRLMDLLVIYLFLENRKKDTLTDEDKEIIKNAYIDYPKFSKEKKEKLNNIKKKILNR